MAKRYQLPIREFLELTSNERGIDIAESMQLFRELFPIDEEWIHACLNRIPENQQEILYVTYLLGASMLRLNIQQRQERMVQ